MAQKKKELRTDIAVVGGGIAGLCAATALAREGFDCVVVESEPILGGRARSWTDDKTGDPVHIGPHIFLTHYPNFLKFQDVIGARGTINWQEGRFLTMVEGQDAIEIKASQYPPPYHFAPSLLKDPRLGVADLVSNWPMVQAAIELTEEEVRALDAMNGLGFLRTMGVSEAFIERFWTFICFTILNIPVEHASAGAMLRFYRRLIANADLQFGFPNGGLGDTFVPQSEAYLAARGCTVLTDKRVVEFRGTDSKVTGVTLDDGTEISAQHVICSLPPMGLRELARPAWIREHAAFRDLVRFAPVPYKCVYMWFDRKLTHRQFWARFWKANDLNSDFYDYSNIIDGWQDRPSFIQSNIIWCHRVEGWSDEEIVAATLDELCEFLPEAREATMTHSVVNHVPMVICAPYPGVDQIRPDVHTPISGLTLAGDWIQTGFPSTMESAATSGWMAAEDVLGQHGIERSLVQPRADIEGIGPMFRRIAPLLPNRRRPRWLKSWR